MGIALTLTAWYARAIRRTLVLGPAVDAADLIPHQLPDRVGFLVQGSTGPSWAAFTCPCGTGHQVLLNLNTARRPRWQLSGTRTAPTLHPSIDVTDDGYRCHFWIRRGRLQWVGPPRSTAPHSPRDQSRR